MVFVLLADDNRATCSALHLLLSARLGVEKIASTADWPALLEMARAEQPEVILFDWELPGGPAPGQLAALRRCAPRASLIALSARPEARDDACQSGVEAFIAKSEPPAQVVAVMERFLQARLDTDPEPGS
jgi:DNA-binding NarL/FixJ family response regulator